MITLEPLKVGDQEQFVKDNQEAFNKENTPFR